MDKVKRIHDATMNLLENVGVDLYNDRIINLLKKNNIKTDGYRAFFTEKQIMEWVGKAPKEFELHARNKKYNMKIGGVHVNFAPSNSGFPIITEMDGRERPAVYKDYIEFLKLVQQTPYYNINGGVMVTPNDLKNKNVYPTMLLSTIIHSDKCLFGGMGGFEESNMTMNMLKILYGESDFIKNSKIITIISSASPLQYSGNMLETMIEYIENGQAVIIAPAVMAGTTGPVTMAGTIAISNAETLVGVAVAQMIKEGSNVIYGSATSTADLRDGTFCIGAPESALAVKYCAMLAKFYGLPSRGGGTLNDAKTLNMQAGYEGMMCLLTAADCGINFILHSAGGLGGYRSMSFEKYVADLDIIGMVKRYTEDLNVSDNNFAEDIIKNLGPGNEYITSEHTYNNFRTSTFIPEIAIRGSVKSIEADSIYFDRINRKKDKMLESFQYPELDKQIKKDLFKYLNDNSYEIVDK